MPKLPGMGATGVAGKGTAGTEETGAVGTAETGTEVAAGIGATSAAGAVIPTPAAVSASGEISMQMKRKYKKKIKGKEDTYPSSQAQTKHCPFHQSQK